MGRNWQGGGSPGNMPATWPAWAVTEAPVSRRAMSRVVFLPKEEFANEVSGMVWNVYFDMLCTRFRVMLRLELMGRKPKDCSKDL